MKLALLIAGQERKINSPLEKHWSKLLMLLISPPVTHHVIFSKLIRVLIKLFLGYIIWINSCLLATQATKPHKLIPTKIIFLHLRYLDERRGLIRCLLSAPRAWVKWAQAIERAVTQSHRLSGWRNRKLFGIRLQALKPSENHCASAKLTW